MKKWRTTGLVVAFVIGTLLGTGSCWQFATYRMSAEKQELDAASKLAELRGEANTLFFRILSTIEQYLDARERHAQEPTRSNKRKLDDLEATLLFLKSDFEALENTLATLEGRKPRPFPAHS